MAKLTLTDGTIFEGTTEEIFAITERYNGAKASDPIAESLTHNGAAYTLVDRKAQEGDIVSVSHKNGDCFKPRKLYGPCFVDNGGAIAVNADSSTGRESHEVARVYNDYYGRTTETVLVYAPKAEPLKVGDYAKVVGLTGGSARHNGKIVELTKRWEMNSTRFNVANIVEDDIASCDESNLRKATDEEVAEAKAKAGASAEQARKEAIFTQAGRKPNEYRKGDIVEFTNDYTAIGVVEDVGDRLIGVRTEREKYAYQTPYKTDVKPITFVESRLDK